MLFRSNDTATTEIYTVSDTLSLHDALPIFVGADEEVGARAREPLDTLGERGADRRIVAGVPLRHASGHRDAIERDVGMVVRSEAREPFLTQRQEAERRPLGAVREYADVFHPILPRQHSTEHQATHRMP